MKIGKKLTLSLNAISHPQFHVTQRSVRYHYSAMETRKKERSGKKREPQVLPLRRRQSYNSFLTNSWNFSKKATKTWKKQNGIRKKRQESRGNAKGNANKQQGGKQKKKQSQWSKHYDLPERTGRDGSNLEE